MCPSPAAARLPGSLSSSAWTLQEALAVLESNPHDRYLQYVALQLAGEAGRLPETVSLVQQLAGQNTAVRQAAAAPGMLALLSGAAAIQECLQLDVLQRAGQDNRRANTFQEEKSVSDLPGVTVRSHPWTSMLAGKTPEVSCLSKLVPSDFLYVECSSVNSLFETIGTISRWSDTVALQLNKEAAGGGLADRLAGELALPQSQAGELNNLVRELALTTSDLFAADGSDLTVLFLADDQIRLRSYLDEQLTSITAEMSARFQSGTYSNVAYRHVFTPDRRLNVFAAEPVPGVHLRSNSLPALRSVIDTSGGPARNSALGESDEFRYVRTLMPWRHSQEDVFIYLSDPFIRALVGPQLRLSARRKYICKNYLSMLEHAVMFYCTQYARLPDSIDTLIAARCAPPFNRESLTCPDGGYYSLIPDGERMVPACSHHGCAGRMLPCLETPVARATAAEAAEYEQFLEQYNRYWLTYFDPIAIRLKNTESVSRAETIVLPLIDNSIYRQLSTVLGGAVEPLDDLPVPAKNIFTTAFRFNKEALRKSYLDPQTLRSGNQMLFAHKPQEAAELEVEKFLTSVLANQIGLHVYDSSPMLSLDLSALSGILAALANQRQGARANPLLFGGGIWLWITFAIASLNAPVYISLPLQIAGSQEADSFLAKFYSLLRFQLLQKNAGGQAVWQAYRLELEDTNPAYCVTFQLGPARLRVHWARIGNGIYIASKSFILSDLLRVFQGVEADGRVKSGDAPAGAHAMVRFACDNWKEVLSDMSVNQAETNRVACLANLTALYGSRRAQEALAGQGLTCRFDTAARFCPDGGIYTNDELETACPVHGNATEAKQPLSGSKVDFMGDSSSVTALLSFLEDGLQAVLTIDRRRSGA